MLACRDTYAFTETVILNCWVNDGESINSRTVSWYVVGTASGDSIDFRTFDGDLTTFVASSAPEGLDSRVSGVIDGDMYGFLWQNEPGNFTKAWRPDGGNGWALQQDAKVPDLWRHVPDTGWEQAEVLLPADIVRGDILIEFAAGRVFLSVHRRPDQPSPAWEDFELIETWTTTDFVTWTRTNLPSVPSSRINVDGPTTEYDGTWITGGEHLWMSSDAVTWTAVELPTASSFTNPETGRWFITRGGPLTRLSNGNGATEDEVGDIRMAWITDWTN